MRSVVTGPPARGSWATGSLATGPLGSGFPPGLLALPVSGTVPGVWPHIRETPEGWAPGWGSCSCLASAISPALPEMAPIPSSRTRPAASRLIHEPPPRLHTQRKAWLRPINGAAPPSAKRAIVIAPRAGSAVDAARATAPYSRPQGRIPSDAPTAKRPVLPGERREAPKIRWKTPPETDPARAADPDEEPSAVPAPAVLPALGPVKRLRSHAMAPI